MHGVVAHLIMMEQDLLTYILYDSMATIDQTNRQGLELFLEHLSCTRGSVQDSSSRIWPAARKILGTRPGIGQILWDCQLPCV